MAALQCPKCGKPTEGGLCGECHLKDNPVKVKLESYRECGKCGTTIFKGIPYKHREDMLNVLVNKSVKPPSGVKARVAGYKVDYRGGKAIFDVQVEGSYGKTSYNTSLKWDIRPEKTTCDTCKKLGGGYYEAVIQVRDENLELDLDEREVADVESVRGGFDYYFISLDYARKKVSELINRGYFVQDSSKLFGRKGDKVLFRHYYSIKHPHFRRGDFIEHDGKILRVGEIGRMVKLLDVKTSKHAAATLNQLADAKIVAKADHARKGFVTEVRPDGMQIMDETDCHVYEVPLKEGMKQGQELEYLKVKNRVYVL